MSTPTSVPKILRCARPTAPGYFVYARPRGMKFLAQVTEKGGILWVTSAHTHQRLDAMSDEFKWWGPLTLQP